MRQCQDSFVSRVCAYIFERWGQEHVVAIPSTTHFASTSERHILVYIGGRYKPPTHEADIIDDKGHQREARQDSVDQLQAAMQNDANLTGVIKRLYRFDGPLSAAFTTLEEACRWVRQTQRQPTSARLQAFPKAVTACFLHSLAEPLPAKEGGVAESKEGVIFDPRNYELVLSVVVTGGSIFASFQQRAKVCVGSTLIRHEKDAVCKAQVSCGMCVCVCD
jgi:hypothetical protein